MRWCIISRSVESIEYYLDNNKSHDFLMSKYLWRCCLNRIEHELFARCCGQNIQILLPSLLLQTTAPSDHWNHFIPNVNNIKLFRCWPARYSPFKQKQGNKDVCCHSFILKWTCTTSVSFLQIWRLSDSRLYTLHLFLKSYHDIAPKKHLLEGIGVPGKIHGSIISCNEWPLWHNKISKHLKMSQWFWLMFRINNIIRRTNKHLFPMFLKPL